MISVSTSVRTACPWPQAVRVCRVVNRAVVYSDPAAGAVIGQRFPQRGQPSRGAMGCQLLPASCRQRQSH